MFKFCFFKTNGRLAFSLIEISVVMLILGILIAGISQGIDLYEDIKIATTQNITKKSIVGRISDLVGWWETSLDESFDKNAKYEGAEIVKWLDINPQSVNKFLLISNSNSRPTIKMKGINGLPSIEFDYNGSTEKCKYFYNNDFNLSSEQTFFIVFNQKYLDVGGGMLIGTSKIDALASPHLLVIQTNSTASRKLRYSVTTGISADVVANSFYSDENINENNDYVVGIVKNISQGYYQAQINKTVKKLDVVGIEERLINRHRILIGTYSGTCSAAAGTLRQFYGQISELIIYGKALQIKEYDEVMKYLFKKYNIR